MEIRSTALKQALEHSLRTGDEAPLMKVLRRHRRFRLSADELVVALADRHQHIEARFLHPKLLPLNLLLAPEEWIPDPDVFDGPALLALHPDLRDMNELLGSGLLNRILRGEVPLLPDVPAVAIDAYAAELRQPHRRICRFGGISALEHLAVQGRECFRRSEPLSHCLDLYNIEHPNRDERPAARCPRHSPWLLVLDASEQEAQRLAGHAGWPNVRTLASHDLAGLRELCARVHADTWLSICHSSDRLNRQALSLLARTLETEDLDVCSSDEAIHWCSDEPTAIGNPQCRSAPTPWRLISRGDIAGLISLRAAALRNLRIPDHVSCLHELLVDLSLQLLARQARAGHCPHQLLVRDPHRNPTVLAAASPMERQLFNAEQRRRIGRITRERSRDLLSGGAVLEDQPTRPGCHRLVGQRRDARELSVIVLVNQDDGPALQDCLASLQRQQLQPGEIRVVTDGTIPDLAEADEPIVLVRCPPAATTPERFNLARQGSEARVLLFLETPLQFETPNALGALMAPLDFKTTACVGPRVLQPDGSVHHQGFILTRGERRALRSAGDGISQRAVLERVTPLSVQEQVSGVSSACLCVQAEAFDQLNGFDPVYRDRYFDIDLCLRLAKQQRITVVTPECTAILPRIVDHDARLLSNALRQHQIDQGRLRSRHADLFRHGDPLTSPHLAPHSSRHTIVSKADPPGQAVGDEALSIWRRGFQPGRRPLLFMAQFDARGGMRPDLIDLIREYSRFCDVILIAATPALCDQTGLLRRLRRHCVGIVIRRNVGYDFGSWRTGLNIFRDAVETSEEVILTNDSFWGPVRPLRSLFRKLTRTDADAVGLTDDLMYEPHLQSAFISYRRPALDHPSFHAFWNELKVWESKADLIKQCEVALTAKLATEGLNLKAVYTDQSNGNVLHYDWKSLIIDQEFPFIKVSLLKGNPTQQNTDGWWDLVHSYNPQLAREIQQQLKQSDSVAVHG